MPNLTYPSLAEETHQLFKDIPLYVNTAWLKAKLSLNDTVSDTHASTPPAMYICVRVEVALFCTIDLNRVQKNEIHTVQVNHMCLL